MKEIKAYIRREKAEHVVEKLRQAGAPAITLVNVHPVGDGAEGYFFSLSNSQDVFRRYPEVVVKLELICKDTDADRFVEVLREAATTGFRGDGMIFVSDVTRAVRIRNGDTGEAAL